MVLLKTKQYKTKNTENKGQNNITTVNDSMQDRYAHKTEQNCY